MDDFAFENHTQNIFCCNNYLYSLFTGANAGNDFGIPNWELHDVIMRYFLCYLEINKWYKHQKRFIITKEINIYTTKFRFKKMKIQ